MPVRDILSGNPYAYSVMERALGFGMMWHNMGEDAGLLRLGLGRSTLYKRKAEFRKVFGFDVSEWTPESAYNTSKGVMKDG